MCGGRSGGRAKSTIDSKSVPVTCTCTRTAALSHMAQRDTCRSPPFSLYFDPLALFDFITSSYFITSFQFLPFPPSPPFPPLYEARNCPYGEQFRTRPHSVTQHGEGIDGHGLKRTLVLYAGTILIPSHSPYGVRPPPLTAFLTFISRQRYILK